VQPALMPAPDRTNCCVVVDGLAYLVSAEDPAQGARPLQMSVTQAVATANPSLLLLVTHSSVTAFGPMGITWQSERIALDGLRVDQVAATKSASAPTTWRAGSTMGLWMLGRENRSLATAFKTPGHQTLSPDRTTDRCYATLEMVAKPSDSAIPIEQSLGAGTTRCVLRARGRRECARCVVIPMPEHVVVVSSELLQPVGPRVRQRG
jgi:hypothetical protein